MITRKTLEQANAEKGYLDAEKFDGFSDADIERSIEEDPDLAPPTESLLRLSDPVQQTVGERGIGVQISGDGNTVTVSAGRAELGLVRKHLRKAEPKDELQLLRVDLRATTLVGRDAEQSALQGWLASERAVSVRCMTGRAGSGKTRLAIELCEHAEKAGWTAGLVQYRQFSEFIKYAGEWRWKKDTLVVVDYAAALARDLRAWLDILAQPEAQSGGYKLRLLLLERHAERDLGWWAELLRPVSFSDPAPDELADPREPVPLQSLSALEDRRAVLAETMRRAAQVARLQPPIPHPPPPGADADFDRRLGDGTINNEPLYLMMAGAEAIRTGASAALALTRIDLAQRAAGRERERLNRLASEWGAPETLVVHLAISVTLQGGCNTEDALLLIEEERRALGFPETIPAAELVSRLADALPMPGGREIDGVRPDLIGEALLLQGMDEHRRLPELQNEIIERAWRRAEGNVVTTLIRAAQDYAQGNADHCSVVWLRHLFDQTADLEILTALSDGLPQQTLALRELAAFASERILALAAEAGRDNVELRPVLASSLNNLALRLSDLGRREPALEAAQEAAALFRELAAQRPDAFRPNLAGSLNNLANMLSALGRREPALEAAQEAVAIRRELAAQRPDAFRPDLAGSLNNLANMLSALGRREPALEAAQEAAALYRELAAQRPDMFRPDLASSLNNLANMLSDLGRREPALEAAQEAVAIRREVAAQRPDAFRPDLASSLNNLAIRLSNLGRREPALEAAQEAAALYRELAAQRPGMFRPDLASSLNNLALRLSDLGRREPALEAAQEAVAIRRELAAQRPDAFRPDLASSLNNLAIRLSDLGRREPALEAAQEAAALYRELAAQRPDAFRPDLASSLNNLANRLSDHGRREPALEMAQEAAALYRELAAQRPDAFRPYLASSLNNLANRLSDLGRREPALEMAQEAAALYRELAAQRPDAFRPDLAGSLNNLANMLSALGRREPALEAAQEAAALYRELAAQRPDMFRPDLASSLNNLANMLSDLGRREPALEAAQEAAALFRELAAQRPDAFRPDLASSLNNLANMLSALGRREPALEAAQEAVAIRRELAAQRPDAFRPDLAGSLAVQANCLDASDRPTEALASNAEAIATLSPAFVEHPAAFAHWMGPMLQQYLNRCERLGRSPDIELVGSVIAILREWQPPTEEEQE